MFLSFEFWLGLLTDAGKTDKKLVEQLLQETKELVNIIAFSIVTLKGKK